MSFSSIYNNTLSASPELLPDILLDRLPVACGCFNARGNLVAANKKWATYFGTEAALELHLPPCQPCGKPSIDFLLQHIQIALSSGSSRFNLVSAKANGEPLFSDITLQGDLPDHVIACAHEVIVSESDEMNNAFLSSSPFAIDLWDENMNLIDCNWQMVDLFGLSHKQDYLARFYELSPEYQPCGTLSAQKARKYTEQALEQGRVRFEFMHKNVHGEDLPTEVTLIRIQSQGRYFITGHVVDLRPLRKADARVREEEETNRMILDACPVFIEMWDENLQMIYCSKRTEEIFGISGKEEYLRRYDELSPELQPCGTPSKVKLRAEVNRALIEGFRRFEWLHIDPRTGEQLPVDTTLMRLTRNGKPIVVGYNHDLRQIKTATEREREAAELTQKLLDNSPMFMEFWDMHGNMITCNQKIMDVFGVSDRTELARRFYDFCPTHQPCGTLSTTKNLEMINYAIEAGTSRCEWLFIMPNGEELPTEATWVHITHQGKSMMIIYSHDLSRTKAAIQKEREAFELTQIILDSAPFVIGVWDEDNNLLTASKQAIDLFKMTDKQLTAEQFFGHYSPAIQPCGTPTKDKVRKNVSKVQRRGHIRFEWMHQASDGEPLPCEVTIVCFRRNGQNMMVSYTKDMRDIKDAIAKTREADERAKLMIEALPIACFLSNSDHMTIDC
ncbi:MAG: PAS domain-containing protein, partial [Defluviitaleaceae bacterium]|nr:PAS domain-containing protein [Defluviitaleaceae bacterium]